MSTPIPPRLAGRPVFRGMAVPYIVKILDDGTPDFKIQEEAIRVECLVRKKCALCGQPLDEEFVFIGGASCAKQGLFIDPANHEECALYAAAACPFLAKGTGYAKNPKNADAIIEIVSDKRPKVMILYYTRSFEIVRLSGHIVAKAGPATKIDYDKMLVLDDNPEATAALLRDMTNRMFKPA